MSQAAILKINTAFLNYILINDFMLALSRHLLIDLLEVSNSMVYLDLYNGPYTTSDLQIVRRAHKNLCYILYNAYDYILHLSQKILCSWDK